MTDTPNADVDSPLSRAIRLAHAFEALGNYVDADLPLSKFEDLEGSQNVVDTLFLDRNDNDFWSEIFGKLESSPPLPIADCGVHINRAVISEWVPRVPGLYWRPSSAKMRRIAEQEIAHRKGDWVTYTPRGKSQKVAGGIGTLKLTPSENGFRLVTLSVSYNASAGIPALISPDVWESCRLREGALVQLCGRTMMMPSEWAREFPSIQGIPKVCVILDDPDSVYAADEDAPVLIHPFSIMNYWDGSSELLDFVYYTADTSEVNFRSGVEEFFDNYRRESGRDGEYLIECDIGQPMWGASFESPKGMRNADPHKLNLIEARAIEAAKGEDTLDGLIGLLTTAPDHGNLKRISEKVGIPWSRWFTAGSMAVEAAQLVSISVRMGKQLELTQAAQLELVV